VTKPGSVSSTYRGRRNVHDAYLSLFLGVFPKAADEAETTVQHQVHNCVLFVWYEQQVKLRLNLLNA